MLTAKQRELLLFIDERLKESGVSPSFDEMREALELKSKSGVHRLISALQPSTAASPSVSAMARSSISATNTAPSSATKVPCTP